MPHWWALLEKFCAVVHKLMPTVKAAMICISVMKPHGIWKKEKKGKTTHNLAVSARKAIY